MKASQKAQAVLFRVGSGWQRVRATVGKKRLRPRSILSPVIKRRKYSRAGENARRRRQIASGQLRAENGLVQE